MAGKIPQSFIDDLLERVDIVELVDSRVKLKKTGKNYMARCPFHDEKTPSFSVSPDKQLYHCFGCGASGNSLGFVMEYDRQDFVGAVETLAKIVGVEVVRERLNPREQARQEARKSLFDVMASVGQYYRQQLEHHAPAKEYLKRRGLSGEVIDAFGIGYVPPGWTHVLDYLKASGISESMAVDTGLVIYNEDKRSHYDRFRHRIMFPIRNTKGQVIAFGGRVLNNDKPKYINSPETALFNKGKELYGLYEARQAYKELPRLLVVEGYMDVVALAQYGIRYGVATLGTACGEEHLARAFRYTNEIVFCFDGDSAGRKAALRAMEHSLSTMEDGRQIRFLYLPEGEDPDSLVRQVGAEKFTRLIESAPPLERFLFDELASGLDVQTMEGRARLAKLAMPHLDRLPKGVYRELMMGQLAKRTQLTMASLTRLLEDLPEIQEPDHRTAEPVTEYRPNATSRVVSKSVGPEGLVITLLLYQPQLGIDLDLNDLSDCQQGCVPLLRQLVALINERPQFTSSQILGHWQGMHGEVQAKQLTTFMERANERYKAQTLCAHDPDRAFNPKQELDDALMLLRRRLHQERASDVIARLVAKPMESWTAEERSAYSQAVLAQSDAVR